tara:strand:- start:2883 stop:3653 length:771 start_codon:yes stop_codon:yes gene_type:complete
MDKEKIAEEFSRAIQKAQAQMVEDLLELKGSLSRQEFISLLSTLNVDDYLFNEIGLQKDLDKYLASYQTVLSGMQFTGKVTEETLLALVRLDQATFKSQIGTMGEQIIDEAVKGILGGKTERQIAQSMLGNVLRPDQAQTLANTALNTFERNVTAEMAVNDPSDATYVYQGVIDDKTRDICLDMMSAGSLKRDEVDSLYPGAFSDGGGFNCRHRWARETSVSKKLTDPKEAKGFIDKKGGFKRVPLTPQQQLQQRG